MNESAVEAILAMHLLPGLRLAQDEIAKLISRLEGAPQQKEPRKKKSKDEVFDEKVTKEVAAAKSVHWTQTPEGRARQRRRARAMWKKGVWGPRKGGKS
jgi:hypothetical protein